MSIYGRCEYAEGKGRGKDEKKGKLVTNPSSSPWYVERTIGGREGGERGCLPSVSPCWRFPSTFKRISKKKLRERGREKEEARKGGREIASLAFFPETGLLAPGERRGGEKKGEEKAGGSSAVLRSFPLCKGSNKRGEEREVIYCIDFRLCPKVCFRE